MDYRKERHIAWGLGLALFGLIMLSWNGVFHSSDGLSMYTVADSLVRYGRWDTEQIRWTGLQQGMFGPDDLLYSRKAPGTSILALPLTLAGLILPGLGPVHSALLLMPLVTAATGALLYLAGRRAFPTLPRLACLLGALAWGLGSPAWPYAKTFFSDPLVALTTIGALERLLAFEQAQASTKGELKAALGLGFWLALGLFTRLPHAIVLPIFGLAFLIIYRRRYDRSPIHSSARLLFGFGGPIFAAVLMLLAYNWQRFGNVFVTGYLPGEAFSAVWWQGLVGLTISPGRGLLWYAPWVVLAVVGAVLAWRQVPVAAGVAVAVSLLYVLVYAKWYVWHGGYCWGPRFLVVILPLLAWMAIPAAGRWPRLFGCLVLLGIGVNLIGVAWDFDAHQDLLVDTGLPLFDWSTFFDPRYAQILGMLRLGRLETLDMMWIVDGRFQPRVALPALLLAGIGLVSAFLVFSGRNIRIPGTVGSSQPSEKENTGFALGPGAWITLLVILTTYVFLWQARAVQSPGYSRVAQAIDSYSPPGTNVWHNDHRNITTFLNIYKGRAPITGLLETRDTLSENAGRRLAQMDGIQGAVWVISRSQVGDEDIVEATASRHRGQVEAISVATSLSWTGAMPETAEPLKATLYYDTPNWRPYPVDVSLERDGLPLIQLTEAYVTPPAQPGRLIALRLVWETLSPLSTLYQVVVQVIGPDGEPVALQIQPAQNGQAPTTAWQPGQPVIDVHAFQLPERAVSGDYYFIVALQSDSDSTRLQTRDGREQLLVGPIFVSTTEVPGET